MTKEIVYEVITKLTGKLRPVGDSSIDEERLTNLKLFIEVFNLMHIEIDDIAYRFHDSPHASIKRIADECSKHLDSMGIEE
jgi:hypothetical protein